MNFKSDNIVSVHPKIMNAILKANHGTQPSYGNDEYSKQLQQKFSDIFEKEVTVYLTNTGSAANALGLSALVNPYDIIYCHKDAHINTDECNDVELFTSGAKLVSVGGAMGKIQLDEIEQHLERVNYLRPHSGNPGCISITQATECGTVYQLAELQKISEFARKHEMPVHLDGARFSNALVSLGCTPAEATWKSGIDIMSFGGTKNGALCAEAIIFFNKKYTQNFAYLHKRAGQLASKMRFFSAQFIAYLEDNLWLENARFANTQAQKLSHVFTKHKITCKYPVDANELFPILPKLVSEKLTKNGANFYEWERPGSGVFRFVVSCFTQDDEIESIDKILSQS